MTFTIQTERPEDLPAIRAVVEAAFRHAGYGPVVEHRIVDALREAGALALSLVAELDGEVVGHVAFSRVLFEGGPAGWFGLGPLAVLPALHRQGIGSALAREGLARLEAAGGAGCVVVGDPAYYRRFGFVAAPGLEYPGIPAEYVTAKAWRGPFPAGPVDYHAAFSVAAP